MSLFRISLDVSKRLERGGIATSRKPHLVRWDKVCLGKEWGGLGLRTLALMNEALLGKWIWRFASEQGSFWRPLICIKYGEEDYGWKSK